MHKKSLVGTLERIVFTNEENGYIVARFSVPKRYDLITVVGNLAGIHAGASLRLWGAWKTHPVYGEQFVIENYREERPATIEGIRKYLGSGLIKGIGPVTASRIAEHFGPYTLEVIEENIERLVEVPGVGPKRVKIIAQAWEAQKHIKEIMLFLQSHGVSTRLAVKIYKTYGDEAIQIVNGDPYRLARDIYGIGFITADKIARSLGAEPDSTARIQAGLAHVLNTLADEGHVYAPRPHLVQETAKLLGVPPEKVEAQIDVLAAEERLHIDQEIVAEAADPANAMVVYLIPFYRAEVGVARQIRVLLAQAGNRGSLAEFQAVD
ncbi:MAG TPA: helix-hairpin-helix domain-containing protein, partial [Anaerolineae bacterium]|nr:helix-hairpin-helix domain-containing protein [Anaerolineae bacterium]